ncbi:DUF1285 domain-containing protein [Rhodospirillum sp. A1_3_36]|uniref:DUF1285 domain-containing protein n=1 Tax=Rhodospirillum sp. A1_3_36 TaxID=3391666 RepID=UPI0039A786E1
MQDRTSLGTGFTDPPVSSGLDPLPQGIGPNGGSQGVCGDIPIRIDSQGVWHYRGSPIGRKEMVCLFASVLRRMEDGSFWLVTPVESGRIEVEDAPFLAVEMFRCGLMEDQCLSFRTNVDEIVTVDADHPLRMEIDPESGEPSPYVTVRPGLDARLVRSVYYDLVALGMERDAPEGIRYGVWSNGIFFPLGSLDDGLSS